FTNAFASCLVSVFVRLSARSVLLSMPASHETDAPLKNFGYAVFFSPFTSYVICPFTASHTRMSGLKVKPPALCFKLSIAHCGGILYFLFFCFVLDLSCFFFFWFLCSSIFCISSFI